MDVSYAYTGYYALQSNYLDSSNAFQSEEYTTIPSTSLFTLTDSTVAVEEHAGNVTINLDLAGYNDKTITAVNGIFFFDVRIPSLEKRVSVGYMMTVKGNFERATITGDLSLHTNQPING